ncbi:MAG: ribonuclease III [Alphaproteobacteria bacterium]|nr:ribonuclease III [Alphaproteobacteria bacterium]
MEKLHYNFKDQSLLDLALTQSGADAQHNNERLEFVGDRVLGLTVAEMLYKMFPNESEGDLARRHALLVSAKTLANVAARLGLGRHIRHGHLTGGRLQHILADAMEAVLGAIFIDSGWRAARAVIIELWTELARENIVAPKDPKTKLQEYVQKNDNGALPVYQYLEPTGASHCPVFNVRVSAMGKTASGSGASKKAASIMAAEELLKILAI